MDAAEAYVELKKLEQKRVCAEKRLPEAAGVIDTSNLLAMENEETVKIDLELEKITSGFDRQSRICLKKAFDKIASRLLIGDTILTFVIDANIVLSEAISHTRTNRSGLLALVQGSPFLRVVAPPQIHSEVRSKFAEVAEKNKIPVECLAQSVDLVLANIKLMEPNELSRFKAHVAFAQRDLKDADYAALYFSSKADGIITKDKDFSIAPDIKTWTVSKVGRILTRVENGAFSLVVVGNGLPAVLQILYNAVLYVLGLVYRLAVSLTAVVIKLLRGGISALLSSPILILLAIGVVGVLLHAKNSVYDFVQGLAEAVKKALSAFATALKSVLEFIGGFLNLGMECVIKLFKSITMTFETYASLRDGSVIT